ncbi:MAG: prepilin-type N-terminal cleavage/methylation domain-containing protein [Planctomycetota bacterium]|nr:prepilin-type N-terminal cleavage/methylation domain-containing protein [Planctomycetota bacterium]
MKTRMGLRRGFTLIELLVVIVIIVIIATMSLALLGFFSKGVSIKGTGRTLEGLFLRARQLASSKRQMHFLLFHPDTQEPDEFRRKPFVLLIEDTNRNSRLQFGNDISAFNVAQGRYLDKTAAGGPANGDTIIGEPVSLPRGVVFNTNTRLFITGGGGPFRIGFMNDGSLYLGATGDNPIIQDGGTTFSGNLPTPATWDLGVRQLGTGNTDGNQDVGVRLYLDYVKTTGKLTKKYFVTN